MADIRVLLTDKTITQLLTPKAGWYLGTRHRTEGLLRRCRKAKTDVYDPRRSPTRWKACFIYQGVDRGHF